MATPRVAGMVLYAMSVHGIYGVEALTNHIVGNGLPDVVKGGLKESVNLMADLGDIQTAGRCCIRIERSMHVEIEQ